MIPWALVVRKVLIRGWELLLKSLSSPFGFVFPKALIIIAVTGQISRFLSLISFRPRAGLFVKYSRRLGGPHEPWAVGLKVPPDPNIGTPSLPRTLGFPVSLQDLFLHPMCTSGRAHIDAISVDLTKEPSAQRQWGVISFTWQSLYYIFHLFCLAC